MSKTTNKIISGFLIFLIIGLSFNTADIFAQSFDERTFYDADGDGVCNWKSGDENYQGKEEIAKKYCTITPYEDLCPGTEGSAGHYGSEDSGCSNAQLQRIRNYWSVSAGALKPGFLKVNWLTDSRNGARAYQEIKIGKNFRTAGEEVGLREVSASCENDRGIVYQGGKIIREDRGEFVSARLLPTENPENPTRIIELKVHQIKEGSGTGEVRTKSISDVGGIDEIRTTCTIRTYSCRKTVEGDVTKCINLYPPETDQIELRIPIDTTVIRPEAFLDRGIELSQNILDLTNKLIPKVNKIYTFTLKWCGISLGIVSAAKLFGFLSGFSDLAELIWYGPEELRGISFTLPSIKDDPNTPNVIERKDGRYNSFIISGRSMCAAAVCPNSWCRLGNVNVGGKPLVGTLGMTEKGRQKNIQDSLLLSVGCGCVSGILVKLYQLRAIADSWNSCLKQAKAGETFKGSCDRILSNGICTFVFDELAAFKGVNLMSVAYDKVLYPLEKEVAEAFGLKQIADENRDRFADFATSEVKAIGDAYGVGVVGYGDLPIGRSICSLAVYGRLPTINVYSRFDIDKPVIKTSANVNWDSAQVIIGPDNQPVYEYSVEWMIVAGRDNLRYEVYLKTLNGGKSQRLDSGSGRLARIGDYDSDYVQFVDTTQYVEACIEVPDEFLGPKCFAPGTGSNLGITGDFLGFSAVDDDDKDGLPNEWERRHGFDSNNWDSDKDGIGDGQEDNDQDGVNNYNEYKSGTDPKKARLKEDGSYVESECIAAFKNDFFLEKAVYNPGEMIRVNGLNVVVDDKQAEKENIALKVEITESRGDFRKNVYLALKDVINKNTLDIWNIAAAGDELPPNGVYDVKFILIKWESSFSSSICVDSSGKVSNSVKNMNMYIGKVEGCFDSDRNNIHSRGVCIDKDNFPIGNIDSCINGNLVEYICGADEKCVVDASAKCSEFETCSDGKCVLKSSYIEGVCFDKDDINPYLDKCDPKDNTKLIKYDQVNDECIEKTESCGANGVCKTKTIKFDNKNTVGRNELIGKSVNIGYCQETIPGVPEGFTIFNPYKFPTDEDAKRRVETTIKNLNSYSSSLDIWGVIKRTSKSNGVDDPEIDPKLILALITTESQGLQSSASSANAIGIMQIVPSEYPALNSDRLSNDVAYNLEAGIRILKLKEGVNDNTYTDTINACKEPQRKAKYMKYLTSNKWDSALRLYNGGGCNCSNCDDDFVEKVNKYYGIWKITLFPPPV